MDRLKNMPIRRKLTTIVLLTCGILMALSAIFFMTDKFFEYRRSMVSNITTLAEVIGMNSTAALVFQDPVTAEEILSALSAEPEVMAAVVFKADSTIFATFPPLTGQTAETAKTAIGRHVANLASIHAHNWTGQSFSTRFLDLTRPITLNGKRVGHIVIRAGLGRLYSQLAWSALLILALMVLLTMLAKAITMRLHHTISQPILSLVDTIEAVSTHKNYQLRAEKFSRDELGTLIDGFNSMLAEIEKRDQKLSRHRQLLEEKVQQRTRELIHSNDKLKQEIKERKEAQERLARAQRMEAIGTMAAGVAHDLNNILSGIVSYPELLLMQLPADSDLRKPLTTIKNSGRKAAIIVQDLLTLARRGVTVSEVVDLKQIVEDYLASPEYVKMLSFQQGVRLITQFEHGIRPIVGSPVHLSKTVMNLISNAAEAIAESGTITVSLGNQYLDKPVKGYDQVRQGKYVRLSVTDSGHGIAPADLERIFEPFYTKKKMGRSGTGLGMAVVWGTVMDHDGYIDVVSRPGAGTTFDLYFPATEPIAQQVEAPVSISDYLGAGQTVLVVDDVKEQREIASEILTELGYHAYTVPSGEAAVEFVKERSVELLLLDMIMAPGIDGLDTYRQILKIHPRQRAVIASGYSESDRVKEVQRLGAGGYLRKPYGIEGLAKTVYHELRR